LRNPAAQSSNDDDRQNDLAATDDKMASIRGQSSGKSRF